jgi:spore germination protein KA
MFAFVKRKIFKRVKKYAAPPVKEKGGAETPFFNSVDENIAALKELCGSSSDLKSHSFVFGGDSKNEGIRGAIVFIDGLTDFIKISEGVLKPLLENKALFPAGEKIKSMDFFSQKILRSSEIYKMLTLEQGLEKILNGDTLLICDSFNEGLAIESKGWQMRSVSEPQTEPVIRGPREGFTENFRTNTALIRRRIKSPALRIDHMIIGRQSRSAVCLVYIDGIVKARTLKILKERLNKLNTDTVIDSGNLEQYIEDSPFSLFYTIGYSEKPDVVCARILEGRIGIISDGSPFVLTVPMLFMESFQMPEDYYVRTIYASFIRLLRYLAYGVSVFAPAVYIALTAFHQELIPTTLLITIAKAKEGVPFPSFAEALIMVFAFEILREAGLRLPRPVGQAMSIVGALIMGEAAVSAGIVGAPMVITVAVAAVAGFIVPDQNDSASVLRLLMMFAAAMMGSFGIAALSLWILIHLASLQSFGTPYLSGFIPFIKHDLEDGFIRAPLWLMEKRPYSIGGKNRRRKKAFYPPDGAGK